MIHSLRKDMYMYVNTNEIYELCDIMSWIILLEVPSLPLPPKRLLHYRDSKRQDNASR